MDKFPFKMGVILAWSFNMGTFCLYNRFRMSHIFILIGIQIIVPLIDTYITLINTFNTCAVSEIKVIFGVPTGCTSPKTVRPGISPCTLCICSYNNWLKKRAHTGCTPPKIVHPAVKVCAPGAGCTLNFGH